MLLHHYTSIHNLALILHFKTIRFRRMDLVDDLKEADGVPKPLETCAFISCWTEDAEESIPLWKMYTQDLAGVMITLPKNPFKEFKYKAGETIPFSWTHDAHLSGDQSLYLPAEDYIKENYNIIQFYERPGVNEGFFYKKVEYRDDYKELYKNMIRRNPITNITEIIGLFDVGRYKSKKWAFQNECRYTMYADRSIPLTHALIEGDVKKQWEYNRRKYSLENFPYDQLYPLEQIDLPLREECVENIIITLGPKSTISDEFIVKALTSQ